MARRWLIRITLAAALAAGGGAATAPSAGAFVCAGAGVGVEGVGGVGAGECTPSIGDIDACAGVGDSGAEVEFSVAACAYTPV